LSAHDDVVTCEGFEIVTIEARPIALSIVGFSLLWKEKKLETKLKSCLNIINGSNFSI
jgi:hypothetical protein